MSDVEVRHEGIATIVSLPRRERSPLMKAALASASTETPEGRYYEFWGKRPREDPFIDGVPPGYAEAPGAGFDTVQELLAMDAAFKAEAQHG